MRMQPSHDETFQEGDTIIALNKNDEQQGPEKVIAMEANEDFK